MLRPMDQGYHCHQLAHADTKEYGDKYIDALTDSRLVLPSLPTGYVQPYGIGQVYSWLHQCGGHDLASDAVWNPDLPSTGRRKWNE